MTKIQNKTTGRTGFTTGACAAAAAKAATQLLVVGGDDLNAIETTLPNRQKVTFQLHLCQQRNHQAVVSIIKDAGDDPDCTHGAEITATVRLTKASGISVLNGRGVGLITKPGLGIEVGAPSITAIPRRNICAMVTEVLSAQREYQGARVVISVPGGGVMAKKTINKRLGIIGGISILGTTGIVRPFSTAAFRASVIQEIEVACAQGIKQLVMTTGGRSEHLAMTMFSAFPEESFIQVGDFIGAGLRQSAMRGIKKVHIVGMIGKLSKMADGKMQTHVAGSKVNTRLLARLAKAAKIDEDLCVKIQHANTARHVLEMMNIKDQMRLANFICQQVSQVAMRYADDAFLVEAHMFDFQGNQLSKERKHLCLNH